jgi:hypothetical protein
MQNNFFPMISRFGETVEVRRKQAGQWVNGRWVEGAETGFTAQASIQPMRGKHMEFLPEAQRTGEEMVAYITVEVLPSSAIAGTQTDIIVWRGVRYKVLHVKRWLPTQIHWEAIITREVEA